MSATRLPFAVLAVLLVAGARPDASPAAALPACTAAEISAKDANCPANTGPCTITKDFAIGNGCTLDFGTRALTIAGSSTLTVASNTIMLLAGSFTMAPSAAIDARGNQPAPNDRGGVILIRTTGNVLLQKATALARIDISGNAGGGTLRIFAGGSVTIAGRLQADALSSAGSAGSIGIDAAGDVVVLPGAIVSGTSTQGLGGNFDARAGGRADLGDLLEFTGGDGGTVAIGSGADTVTHRIMADARGDTGSGGSVDIVAGTTLQLLDRVIVNGATSSDGMAGGCGGDIDIESQFGDLTIAVGMAVDGASPDGGGGTITITANGNASIGNLAVVTARGGGALSCGGDISVDAVRSITVSGTLDASAGSGGGSVALAASGPIQMSGTILSQASATGSYGGDVTIDAGLLATGGLTISGTIDVSGGNCDAFNQCGLGGVIDVAGCDVTLAGPGSLIARAGVGGVVRLTSHEQLTVGGTINATKTLGPGRNGSTEFHHPTRKSALVPSTLVSPPGVDVPHATCTAINDPLLCLSACPTCGDGVVQFPETCDTQGTPLSCDGCSTFCQLEDCDDHNPCTTDSCDPNNGCRHASLPNGTSCSDGLVCTGVELCTVGFCVNTPLVCADANACTIDSCVEPTGCQHAQASQGAACNDGNSCTTGDVCDAAGVCKPGTPVVCDDGRECTVDSCTPNFGCTFAFRSGSCTDDGNPCTNDVCSGRNCIHAARSCDDADPCTADACTPATGCTHTPIVGLCGVTSSTTTSTSTTNTTSSSTTSTSAPTTSSTSTTSTSASSTTTISTSTSFTSTSFTSTSSTSTTSTSRSSTSSSSTSVTTTSTSSTTSTTGLLCGNGIVDSGEQCDGLDLNGASCPGGSAGGGLVCTPGCTLDFSGCPLLPTTSTSTSSSTSSSTTSTSSSTSSSTTSSSSNTSTSTSTSTSITATTTSSAPSTIASTSSSTSSSVSSSSSSSNSSSSSTSSSTSTSTSIAPCIPALCDDQDPCTRDGCAGTICQHTDRTGVDGVTCAFEASGLRTPLCVGETIPAGISKKLTAARQAADRAKTATTLRKAKRGVKKSASILRGLQRTITRLRGRKLSASCADLLAGAVDDALVHTDRWLAAPAL